tara:strand:+ start:206 stop:1363 length:1158 start_codon:yes stop_codon:yes gene_type:complete
VIPYGRQSIIEEDIIAVSNVLRSDFLTQGPIVPKFEKKVSSYCKVKYAFASNSATSALHLSCLALGLRSGDWLWTSPVTFVASSNCGLYCGAKVSFVDIDPSTLLISITKLEEKLEKAKKENCLPKIVVPVHLCGQSCDMKSIYDLSIKYGFKIIEDASHAIGGKYNNTPIGSCRYSDICVFSFHPVKIITTGEGGMAVTNNKELAEKINLLRSHGITRETEQMTKVSDGPWYYQQLSLGFNYRMTDIQGALGISQIMRLDSYVNRRNELASNYNNQLDTLPITLPAQHKDCYSSYHLYVIRLNLKRLDINRKDVFLRLREKGIGVNVHYIPIHMQPYYQNLGFKKGDYPEAENYYEEAISLPIFPMMSEKEQNKVVAEIKLIIS